MPVLCRICDRDVPPVSGEPTQSARFPRTTLTAAGPGPPRLAATTISYEGHVTYRNQLTRAALFAALAIAPVPSLHGQTPQQQQMMQDFERRREEWSRIPDLFAALEVRPGSRVADIGAGGGLFTARLSRAVGPSGRVFAVDIDTAVLRRLRLRVERDTLSNVEVVEGTPTSPRLAAGTLDAILIVHAYHEFTEVQAMLREIVAALKPGGRVAILDQSPFRRRVFQARAEQTQSHSLASWFGVEDLVKEGLQIVELQDPFIWAESTNGQTDQWLVVAMKPAAGPR